MKRKHGTHHRRRCVLTSLVAIYPNKYPAPRGLTAHPGISSGSDHIKSQYAPWCGISWSRSMTWIWSIVLKMGDRPPWTQNILLSTNCQSVQKDKNVNKDANAIVHINLNLPQPGSSSRKLPHNTSKDLRFRTSSRILRRIHRLVWSGATRDFLSKGWYYPGTALSDKAIAGTFRHYCVLDQRNRPWRYNLCWAALRQFWTTQGDRKIVHEYHRISTECQIQE